MSKVILFYNSLKIFLFSLIFSFLEYQKIKKLFILNNVDYYFKKGSIFKYFIKSGIAGGFSYLAIHGDEFCVEKNKKYSLLVAYWSAFLIVLDDYLDEKKVSYFESKKIIENYNNILLDGSNKVQNEEKEDIFVILDGLANELFYLIDSSLLSITDHEYRRKALKYFKIRLNELKVGQVNSALQTSRDSQYDWLWYQENSLDKKFTGIFTSILTVFFDNKDQWKKQENLINDFLRINLLFVHRQVMDDFLDLKEDCEMGILATPAYLLLMVGEVKKNESLLNYLDENSLYYNVLIASIKNENIVNSSFYLSDNLNKNEEFYSTIYKSGIMEIISSEFYKKNTNLLIKVDYSYPLLMFFYLHCKKSYKEIINYRRDFQ